MNDEYLKGWVDGKKEATERLEKIIKRLKEDIKNRSSLSESKK